MKAFTVPVLSIVIFLFASASAWAAGPEGSRQPIAAAQPVPTASPLVPAPPPAVTPAPAIKPPVAKATPTPKGSNLNMLQSYLPPGFTFNRNGQPLDDFTSFNRTQNDYGTLYRAVGSDGPVAPAVQLITRGREITDVVAEGSGVQPVAATVEKGRVKSVTYCRIDQGNCVTANQAVCEAMKGRFGVDSYREVANRMEACVGAIDGVRSYATKDSEKDFRHNFDNIVKVHRAILPPNVLQSMDYTQAFLQKPSQVGVYANLIDLSHLCEAAFGGNAGDLFLRRSSRDMIGNFYTPDPNARPDLPTAKKPDAHH
jgi:hypothetical protein